MRAPPEPLADALGVLPVVDPVDGAVVPVADGAVEPVEDGAVAPVVDGAVAPVVDGAGAASNEPVTSTREFTYRWSSPAWPPTSM